LAIALNGGDPYSWARIPGLLGFSRVALRRRLKAFRMPLHRYAKREMLGEAEGARGP